MKFPRRYNGANILEQTTKTNNLFKGPYQPENEHDKENDINYRDRSFSRWIAPIMVPVVVLSEVVKDITLFQRSIYFP
jgi:hypothetical protein